MNFEKLSGEQVCKSAIAIRFNLLQVGPSDASLFFDLLPYLFLLFMLWEAISKFYSFVGGTHGTGKLVSYPS